MADEPLYLRAKSYGNETVTRSAASPWQVALGLIDEPTVFKIPAGVGQVLMQGRMCGDYYAEISGPKLCRSAVGSTPEVALARALAA